VLPLKRRQAPFEIGDCLSPRLSEGEGFLARAASTFLLRAT
jgi:hypothetical protein